jgi:Flp pilus assembly protein TadG
VTRVRATGARRERGAVLVEASIVFSFLLLLLFGLVDFGLGWRDKMTTETAARGGVRTASKLGNTRSADYNLLQTVRSGLADIPTANVDRLVVYSANASGTAPATCIAGTPVAGVCNVYSAADFDLPLTAFTGTTSCTGTAPDRFWCPTSRVSLQSAGPDYIGVWMQVHRGRLTGLIPGDTTIQSAAIMRLEPVVG